MSATIAGTPPGSAVIRPATRLVWRTATIVAIRPESPVARTLVLEVPGWPGHLAGQHVDLRLTAEDGYTAQRSYSVASAGAATDQPADPAAPAMSTEVSTVELTVQRVVDGEVSEYLVDVAQPGDQVELRGPVGGYFTWRPATPDPVLLVAGGSGVVPLMSMIRTRKAAASRAAFRLIYSVRDPQTAMYGTELAARVRDDQGLDLSWVYTRSTPDGWPAPAGRLGQAGLVAAGWPASLLPLCYVCGPTGFVEAVADLLVEGGHDPRRVRTERFGPSG